MNQTVLLCLGMHRSGTSATTGLLRLLGVDLGGRLAAGHEGINDLGYFEHGDVLNLHDAVLADLGLSWDSVLPLPSEWWALPSMARHLDTLRHILARDFSDSEIWAVKDPRMCRLLPLWWTVLAERGDEVACLLILRSPTEVAASLAKRDGMSVEKANHLWLEHTLLAERETRGRRRAFVLYDNLLRSPRETLESLERTLGIEWPRPLAEAAPQIEAFLRSDLRHHKPGEQEPVNFDSLAAPALAEATFKVLAGGGVHGPEPEAMAIAHARFADRLAAFDPALVEDLSRRSRECVELRASQYKVYKSWCWKAVKPLRVLESYMRR